MTVAHCQSAGGEHGSTAARFWWAPRLPDDRCEDMSRREDVGCIEHQTLWQRAPGFGEDQLKFSWSKGDNAGRCEFLEAAHQGIQGLKQGFFRRKDEASGLRNGYRTQNVQLAVRDDKVLGLFPRLTFLQKLDVDPEHRDRAFPADCSNGTILGVTYAAKPSVRPDG